MLIFVLVPIVLVLVYSFKVVLPDGTETIGIDNYIKFFDIMYLKVLVKSLYIAFVSTLLCLLLGYPIASILANRDRGNGTDKKSSVLLLFVLPMWMNMLLRTYSWLTILEKNGLLNNILEKIGLPEVNILYTQGAVLLGMVYNFIPFMILPIYSVLVKIDRSTIEAAEDLGANSFNVFRKVTFPLSLPGIISGMTMVFLPAVTSFVVPALLSGGHDMYIGTLIEEQYLIAYDWNFGSAVSIIMMGIVLLSMQIMKLFNKNDTNVSMF